MCGLSKWKNEATIYQNGEDCERSRLEVVGIRTSVLNILSLRYLLDIQVELFSGQLNIHVCDSGERLCWSYKLESD